MEMNPLVRLTGVLTGCPFGVALESCVFAPLRQSSLSDRMHWLHTLTEEEQERFATVHNHCVPKRETDFRSSK